jgi:hypothetical protein
MEGNAVTTGRFIVGLFVIAAVVPPSAGAQSLAEVAKREAERRAASGAKTPAKVYTNTDLTPDFTKPASADTEKPAEAADAPGVSGALAVEGAPAVHQQATEETEPTPRDMKGEAYWRNRATQIRARLSAQQDRVNAMSGRVMALQNAQTPAEQQEWEVTSNALASARADLASFEEEWARFEALAQSQNIPAAWIR